VRCRWRARSIPLRVPAFSDIAIRLSDDGKSALVEFVAAQGSAFKDILADRAVKTFVKGIAKQVDIEAEFKQQKKDFDFNRFGVRLP